MCRATGYRNTAWHKGITKIGITGRIAARFRFCLMRPFLATHTRTAFFRLCHIHMIKWLDDQHAEIAYQYGGD
jgi:hypothetical protein